LTRKSTNKKVRMRCGGNDTIATRTSGAIQHRVCRRGTCHHTYKVIRDLK